MGDFSSFYVSAISKLYKGLTWQNVLGFKWCQMDD